MAQTNGSVLCVAESNGVYYIGGTFTAVINPDGSVVARNRAAAIDASSGYAMPWNPDVNGDVVAVVPSGNTVYLGGAFTTVSGQARSRAAALEAENGTLLPWDPQPNGTVFSMVLDGATMYMGGAFFQIAGTNRFFLGAVNANGAGALLPWNPSADNFVFSLAKQGNTIYAAGLFLNIGGMGRPRVAAVHATTGVPLAWNPASNNILLSIAADASAVYGGGFFATIGGGARQGIAALDPASATLLPGFNANCNNGVLKIVPRGSQLIVGGNYSSIGGAALNNLALLDAATGNAVQWTNSGTNGQIEFNGLAAVNGEQTVLAGGQFTMLGGTPRGYFAVLDQAQPSAVFSQTTFTESQADNGRIDSVGYITLNRTTWLPFGTILSTGAHYTVSGLPNGLSVFLRVVGRQRLAVQFIGQAASHTSADNATVALTFTNAAVLNGNANLINGLNTQSLSLRFIDSASRAALPLPPAPLIQSFSPSTGSEGTQVSIRGSRFTDVIGVRFGGVFARSLNVVSDSLIVATLDNGTSGRIELLRRDTNIFSTQIFTFVPMNVDGVIANINQTVGTVGTRIVLTGRGFTGTTSVLFGGSPVQSFRVDSDNQITAVLGAGASGTIAVVRPQGTLLLNDIFTFLQPPQPVITNTAPRPVLSGDGNYELTVEGRNLALWGEYTMEALSTTANLSPLRLIAYNVSSTSAQLLVPLAFRRIGAYRLSLNVGSMLLSTTFSVIAAPAPVISTQNVVSTLASGEAFTVIVSGSGFFTRGTAVIRLNGALAKGQVVDSARFWVEIPSELNTRGGECRLSITNFDGQSAEAVVRIVPRDGPFITAVEAEWRNNPDFSPRLEFVVRGINFMPPVGVRVTSRAVRIVQEDTMTVRVVIPATVPRPLLDEPPGVLVLTNSDTQQYGFRIAPALFYPVQPVIERVGALVTERRGNALLIGLPIEGRGFQPGTRVFLDTLALEVLTFAPQRIVARVPQALVFPEQPEKRYSLRLLNPAERSTDAQISLSFQSQTLQRLASESLPSAHQTLTTQHGNTPSVQNFSLVQPIQTATKNPYSPAIRAAAFENTVRIFPQPATDDIVIEPLDTSDCGRRVRFYDVYGVLRLESTLESGCTRSVLSLANLPSGVYFLEYITTECITTEYITRTASHMIPLVKR